MYKDVNFVVRLGLNKQIKTLGDNTKVLEDGGPD